MFRLPSGTQVGDWRVVAWQGQGAYGAVYRAMHVGQEHAAPVAIKLSLYPRDARFAREAELLSRLSHPSIPCLLDRGVLRHPLSDVPQERGTAAELAQALEAMASEKVPVSPPASPPAAEVAPPNTSVATSGRELPARHRPLLRVRAWKPWLALAAAGLSAVLLWTLQPIRVRPGHGSASTPQASDANAPEPDPTAVGDTSPTAPLASAQPPSKQKPIAQETLPEPRPGQTRPDEKGRCPGRKQVPLNGGCWVESSSMSAEDCTESGYVRFKGKCYSPALAPPKKPLPTSSPAKAR